jgi:hypothetical protein
MYIIYWSQATEGPNPISQPMIHLQFKIPLAEALLRSWECCVDVSNAELIHRLEKHVNRAFIATNACSSSCAGKKGAMRYYIVHYLMLVIFKLFSSSPSPYW